MTIWLTKENGIKLKASPISNKTHARKKPNLKDPAIAFNNNIFIRKLFLLCKLYSELKMDRETETSDTQKKQELLKTTKHTAERRIEKCASASVGNDGSFALNAKTGFTTLIEIFPFHSPLKFKNRQRHDLCQCHYSGVDPSALCLQAGLGRMGR